MQLLQLYEYLAFLDGGADTQPADDALSRTCLHQARLIWPLLGISAWKDRHRAVEQVVKCRVGGELLVHVSADWKNCFLILVVPPRQQQAEAYLLFDIGAEYREARLVCPAFGLDQVADEQTLRSVIPRLRGIKDPFAILEIGEGTYMQTYEEDGMHDVEYQLVSLSSHYRLEKRVGAEVVVHLFLSYAFGKKEWARDYSWKQIEL